MVPVTECEHPVGSRQALGHVITDGDVRRDYIVCRDCGEHLFTTVEWVSLDGRWLSLLN